MSTHKEKSVKSVSVRNTLFLTLLFFLVSATYSYGATPAGYSEYYIPGDEANMEYILNALDLTLPATPKQPMHSVITVTAWSANTTIYYDHWEYGYEFDPANPDANIVANGGHVEKYVLANAGDQQIFESSSIPTNPRGTAQYYDGGDRIYVAGGAATVTRASWIEATGVGNEAVAWEIYPVKPQLTTYVLPFGENLGATLPDFSRVYVFIQATGDNTVVTVDRTGDGLADVLDLNRDGTCGNAGDASSITLNRGQTFLLDRVSNCGTLNTGVVVKGTETLQVKFIAGQERTFGWMARGFSAFPRGFWTTDYYAPMDNEGGNSDYYLYNPNTSAITVAWETMNSSGSFTIPGGQTVSYRALAGAVPAGSGIYFKGSDVFWGVGSADAGSFIYEWGYSLLPSTMMYNEHYLGWAPDCYPVAAGCTDNGVFLIPAQDNTTVFVDTNNDGVAEQTYTLNRLQTQYITAPSGDLSKTHIWATGPFSMAFGQKGGIDMQAPAMDLGYVGLPADDFVSSVLTVNKSVSPQVVPTASGSQATFTIRVNSQKYTVDNATVTDTLPPSWQYVAGSTTITKPDKTTGTANPTVTGAGTAANPYVLAWASTDLGTNGTMAVNQEVTITFTASTTTVLAVGTLSQNRVSAVGTRTFGTPSQTQTFTATDFVYVVSGNVQITKTSSATDPLYPGDQFTYTVTVMNPASATVNLTGISIYDPLPAGVSYVAGTAQVTGSRYDYYLENFNAQAYTSQGGGTLNWNTNWIEENDGGSPTGGNIRILRDGTFPAYGLRFNLGNNNRRIARRASLSGYPSASISFDYRRVGTQANDAVAVQVCQTSVIGNPITCSDGGGWTTIATVGGAGTDANYVTASYNLAAGFLSANFAVRLAYASTTTANRNIWFDNIKITVPITGTFSAAGPPVLIERSSGYYVAAGQTLTLTYSVTVNNPLASGISSIINTAYVTSNEIPLPVSASVTNLVVNPSSQSAEVGDRVWLDANGNGILDVGEPGLANVEMTLKDQFGTPVMTTTTDATGHYLFTGVKMGNGYYVEATSGTLPSGLTQSAPAGHTDNRTGTFNLSDGQSYTDADLGYRPAPGTAAVGNIVWSDANSNRMRDAGETGLAGVTVQLCYDANGDGILDPAEKAGCPAITTAPDGSYLFTGITADGMRDYFVYIDETQTKLAGYTRTEPSGSSTYYIQDINAGDAVQYANFGYYSASTFLIKDRVWFDSGVGGGIADDGVVNGTETGIAFVTVVLLDASLNAIATTTTDAGGYFTFSGLTGGGADYTVKITDTGGKLTDYYGTTAIAKAGSEKISNLTGDADHSSAPHFGYDLKKAIGTTVFNDMNGNGIQDSGEFGFGGVTVKLYNDANGNGQINSPADVMIATLVTDANGNYLFTGLSDGNYIVSIESPPGGYTYTGTVGNGHADSDVVTTGQQQAATISGGGNDLNRNFGYLAAANRTISGVIWSDSSQNGNKDAGEAGLPAVTVILSLGGTVIATTFTDANGNYSFTGLPSANNYAVTVTDTNGVLNGYLPTYQKTGGMTGNPPGSYTFTGQEAVDTTGGSVTDVNFGYLEFIPTRVLLSDFRAYEENGQVVVEWKTASEENTLGFYLLRKDKETGKYRQINSNLLPGLINSRQGGTYRLVDNGASLSEGATYKLVEVESRGNQRTYGPFAVGADIKPGTLKSLQKESRAALHKPEALSGQEVSHYRREAHHVSQAQENRIKSRKAGQRAVEALKKHGVGEQAKISVTESGLYYLNASDISAVLGTSEQRVRNMIRQNSLSLSSRGQKVAYFADNGSSGIYFYDQGIDSIYTRKNIYWLNNDSGLEMVRVEGKGPSPAAGNQTFNEVLHFEEDLMDVPGLFKDPAADYWLWDYIVAGDPAMGSKTLILRTNGVAPIADAASLTVRLRGGSDSWVNNEHHAIFTLNGTKIGETLWQGTDGDHAVTLSFSQNLLKEGDNTLEVAGALGSGVPYSIFYVNSFDVAYERLYRAVGNTLLFRGDSNHVVSISGFTSPDILLFEVTDSLKAKVIKAVTVDGTAGNYRLSLKPASAGAIYLAISRDAAKGGAEVWADVPSTLKDKKNGADYLVITTSGLKNTAASLASYRRGQGLSTMVVDLEDIMDEYNYGIFRPEAVRDFLSYAYKNWKRAPKYVVLAGEGSYDYKGNLGFGDSLIPPMMVLTPDGLFPSDNYFVADGNHIPTMAIGRLPASTPQELQGMIDKTITYEKASSGVWATRILMTADIPESGGPFTAESDQVASLLPPKFTPIRIYLAEHPVDEARRLLFNELNNGVGLMNYIGHGGLDRLSSSGFLVSDDIGYMTNTGKYPVVTAMTCVVGQFSIPGYDSLAEDLVVKQLAGAVAVWSPTGISIDSEALILNSKFFQHAFREGNHVLGDVITKALQDYAKEGNDPSMMDIYTLLGDPALRMGGNRD